MILAATKSPVLSVILARLSAEPWPAEPRRHQEVAVAKSKKRVPSKPKAERRPMMPREEFVKLWQSCSSSDEAAQKFPSWPQARARAASLREAGVKLKVLGRKSRGGITVDDLNKLCEETK